MCLLPSFPLIFAFFLCSLNADSIRIAISNIPIISFPRNVWRLFAEPPDPPAPLLPYVTKFVNPNLSICYRLLSPSSILSYYSYRSRHGHGNHHPALSHSRLSGLNSLRPKPPLTHRPSPPPDPELDLDLHAKPLALPHLGQLRSAPGPREGWSQQLRRLSP